MSRLARGVPISDGRPDQWQQSSLSGQITDQDTLLVIDHDTSHKLVIATFLTTHVTMVILVVVNFVLSTISSPIYWLNFEPWWKQVVVRLQKQLEVSSEKRWTMYIQHTYMYMCTCTLNWSVVFIPFQCMEFNKSGMVHVWCGAVKGVGEGVRVEGDVVMKGAGESQVELWRTEVERERGLEKIHTLATHAHSNDHSGTSPIQDRSVRFQGL